MIELCRQFTNMYLYGWSPERAAAFDAAIQTVASLNEPTLRARISVMEAALAYLSGRFALGCEKAEESAEHRAQPAAFLNTSRPPSSSTGLPYNAAISAAHCAWPTKTESSLCAMERSPAIVAEHALELVADGGLLL